MFCHENGDPYTSDQLNWRFSKMTRRAGIGHWDAHEGRHTAVSCLDYEQQRRPHLGDQRHRGAQVDPRHETVYRHVIVPEIRGGATVMDDVFDDNDDAQMKSLSLGLSLKSEQRSEKLWS